MCNLNYYLLAMRDSRGKSNNLIYNFLEQNFADAGDKIYNEDGAVIFVKLAKTVRADYPSASSYAVAISEFIKQELYLDVIICAAESDGDNLKETQKSIVLGIKEQRSSAGIITPSAFKIKDMLKSMNVGDDIYLRQLSANPVFGDRELVQTARGFIENDLNVSQASRKGYLHRNTLNYRINKIHKATGLNIRKFWDAAMFEIAAVYRENKEGI